MLLYCPEKKKESRDNLLPEKLCEFLLATPSRTIKLISRLIFSANENTNEESGKLFFEDGFDKQGKEKP